MFIIENNFVHYKAPEMIDWIIWGPEVICQEEMEEKGKFTMKKFNLEKEGYEFYKVNMIYEYNGQEVEVIDGVFYYEQPELEPEIEELDENQLAQLEVLATIYEEILEIKDSISS